MRALCTSSVLALPLLAAGPAEVALRFAPAEGAAVSKTFTSTASLEGGDLRVVMDGQEVPPEFLPEIELTVESAMVYAFTDRYASVADGRPTVLLRTYDEIDETHEMTTSIVGLEGSDDVDEEQGTTGSSTLEGRTVRFAWDAEEGEYARSFEGGDGDVALLEDLEEDTDLRGLLPGGEIEVGDRWEVDAEDFAAWFLPGGDLGVVYEGDGADDMNADPTETSFDGELVLKLTGVHDEGGERLAAIDVEGDVTMTVVAPTDLDDIPVVDGDATETTTSRYELTGELIWNVSAGRLARAELEAETTVEIELVKDPAAPGPTFESVVTLEGTTTCTVEVEAVE